MSKIFQVTVSTIAMVYAGDEKQAFRIARGLADEIVRYSDMDVEIDREITSVSQLNHGWDEKCIPFGCVDDRRIGELLPKSES